METDDLIKHLSVSPRARLGFKARLVIWTVIVLGWATLGIWFGHHEFLSSQSFEMGMVLQSIIIAVAALISGFTALLASTPDKMTSARVMTVWSSLAIFASLIGAILVGPTLGSDGTGPSWQFAGFECSGTLLLNGLFPGLVLYGLARGLGFHGSRIVAFFSLVAAALIGALSLQFACLHRNPIHHFVYHLLPIIVLGAAGIAVAKFVFSLELLLRKKQRDITSRLTSPEDS